METNQFTQWAILELFGHTRIAGLVTEQVIGGCAFVRVDVPGTDADQPFTKLYGQGAIKAMTFVDEETARGAAAMLHSHPVAAWSARRMLTSINAGKSLQEDWGDDDE